MDAVILTEQLTKQYGQRRGLDGLNLVVQPGEVFGFLGPNGAGKTTTIRLLLDLLRPTSGTVRLFGQEPQAGGIALRQRVGYLPGDFVVNTNQRVREFLTYAANLRGCVPWNRVEHLAERLGLDLTARIRSLSKGNRQKVGLVQALMHEPELLILDEPTSGLDPLVQQAFVTLVREARTKGQTVFLSSHMLNEVQQTADRIGIIREGRLVAVEQVEDLRQRAVALVTITFAGPVPAEPFERLPEVHDLQLEGPVLRCRLAGSADGLIKAAAQFTVQHIQSAEPSLEDLFFAYYRSEEAIHAA
ncbi:MAG: ATP-binding cassette domain-containing protein [Oscillochloridaceae bacterium umkhey_bin13]